MRARLTYHIIINEGKVRRGRRGAASLTALEWMQPPSAAPAARFFRWTLQAVSWLGVRIEQSRTLLSCAIVIIYKESMGLLDFKRFHYVVQHSACLRLRGACAAVLCWYEQKNEPGVTPIEIVFKSQISKRLVKGVLQCNALHRFTLPFFALVCVA